MPDSIGAARQRPASQTAYKLKLGLLGAVGLGVALGWYGGITWIIYRLCRMGLAAYAG